MWSDDRAVRRDRQRRDTHPDDPVIGRSRKNSVSLMVRESVSAGSFGMGRWLPRRQLREHVSDGIRIFCGSLLRGLG
jgi:hypothetical protein